MPRRRSALAFAILNILGALGGVAVPARETIFEGPDSFPVSSPSSSTAVADFDGDGHIDVAGTQEESGQVVVLYRGVDGDNDVGFEESRSFAVGLGPVFVLAAELNGDGHPDLISVNSGTDNVTVLLNNGDRNFVEAGSFPVGVNPRISGAGDFDLDGTPDIATSNLLSSDIHVALSDGQGGVRSVDRLQVGDNPHSLVVDDFDGDRRDDIVVVNSLSRRQGMLSFFRSRGDGSFDDATTTDLGLQGDTIPRFLAKGHFDGDDLLDAAVLTDELEVHVFINRGEGSFEVSLVNEPTELRFTPSFLIAGDYTGDGIDDLITPVESRRDAGLRVFAGRDDGSFRDSFDVFLGEAVSAAQIVDFDGDGIDDVLAAWSGTPEISVYFARRPASLIGRVRISFPTAPLDVSVLDPQRDGLSGLLGMTGEGFYHVARATREGGSEPERLDLPEGGFKHFALADLDGDEDRDLAVLDLLSSSLVIHLDFLDAKSRRTFVYPVQRVPLDMTLDDFDGDGLPDVVVADRAGSLLYFVRSPGRPELADETRRSSVSDTATRHSSLTSGDVNGDGRADVVLGSRDGVQILFGDGNGGFEEGPRFESLTRSPGLAVADFDDDGNADLAVSFETNVVVLPNASLAARDGIDPLTIDLGEPARTLTVADVNADDRLDILVASQTAFRVAAQQEDGGFQRTERYRLGYLPARVEIADIDGDGALDVFSADLSSQGVSLVFGRGDPPDGRFRRGDTDANRSVNVTDAVIILGQLFQGLTATRCADATDTDDDGEVTLTDAVLLLNHLFQGGPAPQSPGPVECGIDPTADSLPTCQLRCIDA